MKTASIALAAAILIVLAYLGFWPVPIAPKSWVAASQPGYVGPFAANQLLAGLQSISLGGEEGPEQIALGPDGKLYTTVASGNILRMNPDGSGREVFVNTGGRVLGFDFDAVGNLIAADAILGLLSVASDRKISILVNTLDNEPIRYADAAVVARSGRIYFTDASTRFGAKDYGGTFEASILDILEQSCTGRVLEYDPASKSTRVVASGIAFANGIALSADGTALFVAETGKYRIWKIAVDAQNVNVAEASPKASVLFDNLPGYPDNLMRGKNGNIWAGLVKPRSATVDKLAALPFLRKVTLRLPRVLWPVPQSYGHVFAFTEDGKVVADLQDPDGHYPEATGATEVAGRLYIQSLHAKSLGWLAQP